MPLNNYQLQAELLQQYKINDHLQKQYQNMQSDYDKLAQQYQKQHLLVQSIQSQPENAQKEQLYQKQHIIQQQYRQIMNLRLELDNIKQQNELLSQLQDNSKIDANSRLVLSAFNRIQGENAELKQQLDDMKNKQIDDNQRIQELLRQIQLMQYQQRAKQQVESQSNGKSTVVTDDQQTIQLKSDLKDCRKIIRALSDEMQIIEKSLKQYNEFQQLGPNPASASAQVAKLIRLCEQQTNQIELLTIQAKNYQIEAEKYRQAAAQQQIFSERSLSKLEWTQARAGEICEKMSTMIKSSEIDEKQRSGQVWNLQMQLQQLRSQLGENKENQ